MFTVRLAIGTAGAFALALASVGCIGNKNPDVAADAPAPPPAAYPDTSSSLAGGGAGPVPSTGAAPIPSAATVAGSSAPSTPAPAPFSLREGEQLVAHQIQSGETLSVIAAKYNSSISRIQAANGMKDTKIYAGKTLQIPTSAAST
ncbi:MAG TPA: LysM peptidoglycan-binding domain-containing protein, partial [Bacteroidia bacterium]|nr:LysM peptidoglycan-binding domain-containing protein [Bacteroidia bacterium]